MPELNLPFFFFLACGAILLTSMFFGHKLQNHARWSWLLILVIGLGAWSGGKSLGNEHYLRSWWSVFSIFAISGVPFRSIFGNRSAWKRKIPWRTLSSTLLFLAIFGSATALLWKAGQPGRNSSATTLIGILFLTIANQIMVRQRENEKIEEKQLLVRRMAHALRTPAAAISSLTDALSSAVGSAEEKRFCALIRGEADRLAVGTTRLLRLARGDKTLQANRVKLDLAEWGENVVSRWKIIAPELSLDGPSYLPALVDPDLLDEAVDALIDNAVRYGGPTITFDIAKRKDLIEISVTDDGPGLDSAAQARFANIHSSDGPSENSLEGVRGFGLGQWAASMAAAAHKGSLRLEGKNHFILSLPAVA